MKSTVLHKPNVLWVCTDQQRFDTLNCYGNAYTHTPHLDKLATMGVVFENAYCQSPVCAPSRASFMTGRYPRTCGVRQNGQDIPTSEHLISQIFAENGYACALVGKLHLSACNPEASPITERRIDDGYGIFRWSHHHSQYETDWPGNEYGIWLREHGIDSRVKDLPDCRFVQSGMDEEYHQTTWCADQTIQCMDAAYRVDKPWFLSLNCYDPHHPFDPPAKYLKRYLNILDELPLPDYRGNEWETKSTFQRIDHAGAYDTEGNFPFNELSPRDHSLIKAAYYAMIDLIDVQVGRLLDYLVRTEQLENTIIIFTSDHGELLGDHGMYLKGPHFYECCTHVPLIIAAPGLAQKGMRSTALVELMDIPQTLCDAAGIPYDAGMQGKSLWPLLTGNVHLSCHKETVYSEYYNASINHRSPRAYSTMVYDGQYKLIKIHDFTEEMDCKGELYDLKNDPGEHNNLYCKHEFTAIRARMLEKLCDRMAMTCDPLPLRRAFW